MRIYIPTVGHRMQRAFLALPPELKAKTWLVTRPDERVELTKLTPQVLVLPDRVPRGISPTRQWILEQAHSKLIMIDDDLTFAARGPGLKLHQASDDEVVRGFARVESLLATHAHGCISPREGNNRQPEEVTFVGRARGAIAYDPRRVIGRFDRLPLMEDFDMTLQMLRAGHKNFILWSLCFQAGATNSPGGCSSFRTEELCRRTANALHALHPEFVTVVTKATKWGSGFGGERTDVRVAWKKAYETSPLA